MTTLSQFASDRAAVRLCLLRRNGWQHPAWWGDENLLAQLTGMKCPNCARTIEETEELYLFVLRFNQDDTYPERIAWDCGDLEACESARRRRQVRASLRIFDGGLAP